MTWWTSFFDPVYAQLGLEARDEAARERVVDTIVQLLGVAPGARIFDQCCGIGRLSVPLARRGYRITGVDLGTGYADTARERVGGDSDFHTADAFTFVAPAPCDGAINWFTSFGYAADDRTNLEMLRRARDSLVPGGKLALDFTNFPRVFGEYRPAFVDRNGDTMIIQETTFDFARGMALLTWTYVHPDGRRETRRTENRAYMPYDLVHLFGEAGFVDVQLFGPGAAPFERTSARVIVVGTRA
jgi:SAM-dependent methyltransferase